MADRDLLLSFIREDAPFGDITSEAIIGDEACNATISTRQKGIIAGMEEAGVLCVEFKIAVRFEVIDGDCTDPGAILLRLSGRARDILLIERTLLNIIGRMSGIATLTRRMGERVRRVDPSCRIACTRKTAPGLRSLDKKAVVIGGGDPHRFSLSDGILIKDNHLVLVPLEEAVLRARRHSLYRTIEVEAESSESAVRAATAGADIIMLDNMPPDRITQTLEELTRLGLRDQVVIELSGGITESNIARYAGLGADVISVGFLTHSVQNLDVSLEVFPS
jgi:nicotinate-nucleotide pyrophosphorylase (carboxylating)